MTHVVTESCIMAIPTEISQSSAYTAHRNA
jgi:hypothetical protein